MNDARPTSWLQMANPAVFNRWADRLLWPLSIAALALFAYGLYGTFFVSPADYQQGDTVRIMYIHVPAAWLALFVYAGMALSALGTLVFRHPMADVAQKAAAPLGAAFTLICLVTGSIWGKPTWGTWWQWDARMTSVLVLLLIYLGIMALWRAVDDPMRAARAPSRSASACWRPPARRSAGRRRWAASPSASRPRPASCWSSAPRPSAASWRR